MKARFGNSVIFAAETKNQKHMRKIYTTLLLFVASLTISAEDSNVGWPANYDGVMLQGFYWNSYTDTNWANLQSQADELSQFFNLIWVPQSGRCENLTNQMGYTDIWWLDHRSAFGTEEQLRSMIEKFNEKNVGIIEDVVINHKNGSTSWCDFPNESKNGYTLTWDNTDFSGICKTDECNTEKNLKEWATGAYSGKKATGANDTGDDFPGARDLDHTNATVQQNIKTYLDFLLKDLGYTGFRYDMVKGYAPQYTQLYNNSAKPTYSVGEYWDGDKAKVTAWIDGTGKTSAAFDFPLKYRINDAFSNSHWEKLNDAVLATDANYARYAVTFVDNHDTYRDDNALKNNICAANAFILTMPGTPCLFLPHWKDYKGTLKRLIAARKAVGINNQSTILESTVKGAGYVLKVQGTMGVAMLMLGGSTGVSTSGFQLVAEGRKYKLYVSDGVDVSAVTAITDTDAKSEATTTIPSDCTVSEGEICAFFEAPVSFGSTVYCYRWDENYQYTGSWPGVKCTKVCTVGGGKSVYKWTFKESEKKSHSATNEGIIFNNNSGKQTGDMVFLNGGYYLEDGLWDSVSSATDILSVKGTATQTQDDNWYDLNGRKLSGEPSAKGVYLKGGKKYLFK
jgi:alpha-amylase